MNKKLHRVLDEIQKTEEKIAVWQEHLGELNVQREMLEDAEIIKSVRSMRLGSRELLSVLEGVQNGTVILSERPEMPGGLDGNESMELEGQAEIVEDTAGTTENIAEGYKHRDHQREYQRGNGRYGRGAHHRGAVGYGKGRSGKITGQGAGDTLLCVRKRAVGG